MEASSFLLSGVMIVCISSAGNYEYFLLPFTDSLRTRSPYSSTLYRYHSWLKLKLLQKRNFPKQSTIYGFSFQALRSNIQKNASLPHEYD